MFKIKSSLFKNAVSYSFFNVLNAATPFFLIPILTNYLNNEGYGIVAMFTIVINILNPLMGLSVNGALTKQYFVLTEEEFKKYVSNCLLIFVLSAVCLSGVIYVFNPVITKFTDLPIKWLFVAILISSCQFLQTVMLTLWQVKEKTIRFGLFQTGNSLLNLLLSLYMVIGLTQNWQGRLNAWMVSSIFMALLAIIFLKSSGYITSKLNREYVKHALRFSIPLIPHAIGGLIIGLSDRLIIKNVLGVGQTGIYTVAFQLSSVLSILMTAFNNAYIPWLFKHLKVNDPEQKRRITGLTYICFTGITALVVVGIGVNLFITKYIVGPSFIESKKYVVFLLIAFGFNGMYLMVTNYLFFAEKTNLLARNTFLVSLFNIPMCYYLTKSYGLNGASIATIIAYLLLFLLTWHLSSKVYKMPWSDPIFFKRI